MDGCKKKKKQKKTERVNIYEMACATASPFSAKTCYLSKWGNKRTFLKEEFSIRKSVFSKINGLTRASVANVNSETPDSMCMDAAKFFTATQSTYM